jgi:O-methyltransferase
MIEKINTKFEEIIVNKYGPSLKKIITEIFPDSYKINIITNMPKLKTWEKKQEKTFPIFKTRFELHEHIQNKILQDNSVDYLEFGVFEGATINFWVNQNRNPKSRFYGFDTFTGLPEEWKNLVGHRPSSTWNCEGNVPEINDERIQFFKGLFQNTIDKFLKNYEPQKNIVIHNDSDLYTSSLYLLTRLHDIIKKDTIIIFDEFNNVMDEFRALDNYCASYYRKYKVIGVTDDFYQHVAIQFD